MTVKAPINVNESVLRSDFHWQITGLVLKEFPDFKCAACLNCDLEVVAQAATLPNSKNTLLIYAVYYFANSGGRSVGIVRLRTKATEFSLVLVRFGKVQSGNSFTTPQPSCSIFVCEILKYRPGWLWYQFSRCRNAHCAYMQQSLSTNTKFQTWLLDLTLAAIFRCI
jgi:hypothetical protein